MSSTLDAICADLHGLIKELCSGETCTKQTQCDRCEKMLIEVGPFQKIIRGKTAVPRGETWRLLHRNFHLAYRQFAKMLKMCLQLLTPSTQEHWAASLKIPCLSWHWVLFVHLSGLCVGKMHSTYTADHFTLRRLSCDNARRILALRQKKCFWCGCWKTVKRSNKLCESQTPTQNCVKQIDGVLDTCEDNVTKLHSILGKSTIPNSLQRLGTLISITTTSVHVTGWSSKSTSNRLGTSQPLLSRFCEVCWFVLSNEMEQPIAVKCQPDVETWLDCRKLCRHFLVAHARRLGRFVVARMFQKNGWNEW